MGDKHSELGWFGEINHYDGNGNLTGTSEPSPFGGYDHYDSSHNYIGRSDMELDGSFTNYDSAGRKTGTTEVQWDGQVIHHPGDEANYVGRPFDADEIPHVTGEDEPDGCSKAAEIFGCLFVIIVALGLGGLGLWIFYIFN